MRNAEGWGAWSQESWLSTIPDVPDAPPAPLCDLDGSSDTRIWLRLQPAVDNGQPVTAYEVNVSARDGQVLLSKLKFSKWQVM